MSEVVKKSDNGNWTEYKLNNAWGAVKHMHNTCCLPFFIYFLLVQEGVAYFIALYPIKSN